MNFRKSINTSLLIAGIAVSGVASLGHAQEMKSQGWFKACSDQGKSKICNVQYQAVASTGQVVTSVNLAEITGEVERRVFQITVPTDRRIPPGIEVTVDDKPSSKIPYKFCTNNICAAEVELDDKLVSTLKGGANMEVKSINFGGKESPISIALEGFGAAYDGDPIDQSELRSKQEELQKQLTDKAKTLAEKLQEAQDKAKANAN